MSTSLLARLRKHVHAHAHGSSLLALCLLPALLAGCIANDDDTSPPATYTIGGTVSGLAGNGLALRNNGGDDLAIAGNGAFRFATSLAGGSPYAVSVKTQPAAPSQTCTVSQGTGTTAATAVSSVQVTCSTDTFTVGGAISGLSGSATLQINGGNNLPLGADGAFTFPAALADGSPYTVTIATQPATQTCTVGNGTGTMSGANVSSVQVSCSTNTYTVGGTMTGLTGNAVLQVNGGADLPVAANGAFTFPTALADGSLYAVTVKTQPGSPSQTCTVGNGTGTMSGANITNVQITCANTFTVGGTVSSSTAMAALSCRRPCLTAAATT
jgi:hypothetical protein